jgi:hypothetical protein
VFDHHLGLLVVVIANHDDTDRDRNEYASNVRHEHRREHGETHKSSLASAMARPVAVESPGP